MFRFPKTSGLSSPRKVPTVNPVSIQKNQGVCKFPHRKCHFICLEKYDYCLKHILEDKSAPYKPCPFLYTVSGNKCGKPAFRPERKETWFCAEHNRKAHLQRQKALSKHAPPETQEALLARLGHYARAEQPKSIKREESENEEHITKDVSQAINPFVEVNAGEVNAGQVSQVLDYVSDTDSDLEPSMLDSVWRAQDHESSDAESIDSQAEDPLKHAGTYTAEEVTSIIKDKMIRLQSLYIDQFRRLHHLLKERKRKYLHTLKKEKETLCSIHDQEKNSIREQKLYQKLKSLNHFHKYYGEEAILHKKALERRAQATDGHMVRISHKGKCAFTEGGVKCGAKTLPVTKYCRKHILEDNQQVLFRACGVKRDDHICQEPTLNVFEKATCVYHIPLPPQPHTCLDLSNHEDDEKFEQKIDQKTQNDIETPLMDFEEELSVPYILKPMVPICISKVKPVSSTLEPPESVSDIPNLVEESSRLHEETLNKSSANKVPFSAEPLSAKIENACDKMDVDVKCAEQPTEELQKEENVADDLVMVDMMTDVGVVEEVLEAEQELIESEPVKQQENLRLDLERDNRLGLGTE